MSYVIQEINRLTGKAIHTYGMIRDRDRILVGVSGGKDSLVMLRLLKDRVARAPIEYGLVAVHLDMGYESSDQYQALREHVRELGLDHHFERTDYAVRAHAETNRENPCFLCSRLRRKRLFELARDYGCQKVALGHHRDDLNETLLLNVVYSGEISTMVPVQPFFNGLLTVIRPLCMVPEEKLEKAARVWGLPAARNSCPSDGRTKRDEIREIINTLSRGNPKVKGNIFRSLSNVRTDYLLVPNRPTDVSGARPKMLETDREKSTTHMKDNQRKRTRVLFKTLVDLESGDTRLTGLATRNLSLKGVFVESTRQLAIDTPVEVRLTLSGTGSNITLEMKGKIIRTEENGMGVDFMEIDLDSFQHLRNIVMYNAGNATDVDHELADKPAF